MKEIQRLTFLELLVCRGAMQQKPTQHDVALAHCLKQRTQIVHHILLVQDATDEKLVQLRHDGAHSVGVRRCHPLHHILV